MVWVFNGKWQFEQYIHHIVSVIANTIFPVANKVNIQRDTMTLKHLLLVKKWLTLKPNMPYYDSVIV